jgi:hypothetical protein
MHCLAPIRFLVAASLAFPASLQSQTPPTPQPTSPAPAQLSSTLPATQPTSTPAAPQVPPTPSDLPPKHAQVTYAEGMLSISADNSSLNQILRQISSNTGMKITGGVADERVFGRYGPASPDQILTTLLDGTESNMVLVHGDGGAPAELILTSRHGGATPPNPNAAAFDDGSERRERPPIQAVQPTPPESEPIRNNPVTPASTPAASTETPSANPSQPDSPNGVKTPQQIYEQLQRMRQQQQQQTQPQ